MIEGYGWLDTAGTCFFLHGWCRQPWPEAAPDEALTLVTAMGRLTGPACSAFHPEARDGTFHFVCLLRLPPVPRLLPEALEIAEQPAGRLGLAGDAVAYAGPQAAAALRRRLAPMDLAARRAVLGAAPRLLYDGVNSMGRLTASAVHLDIDRVTRLGATGVLAQGFLVDPARQVLVMRLCAGAQAVPFVPEDWLPLPRPDVTQALLPVLPLEQDGWGFCALLPLTPPLGEGCYLEVELANGDVAQRAYAVTESVGLPGIRQLLTLPKAPAACLARVMNATLGPAVAAMNEARLARPRHHATLTFGAPVAAPRRSLVITLYGRLDFMEIQLGLFSAAPDPACEIIYVLDDPRLTAEAERMAVSCEARFGLPFRLLLLEENWGFAPANNIGAAAARGAHLCLMNSDVFPMARQGMGFLPALSARLDASPGLGAVGPLLLYEDGTVQHAGMTYETVHGLPPWPFPQHPGKARAPGASAGLQPALALTGACLMLRQADWARLGGFDEGYVIGDFEDSDLCLRLREAGQVCGLDAEVRLFHLERQSQEGGAAWRFQATLVNAWRHQARWGASAMLRAAGR